MFRSTSQGHKLSIVLLRLTRLYMSRLAPIAQKYDLTVDQLLVLFRLAQTEQPVLISELAKSAVVQQPAVSKMVPKFKNRDLIHVAKSNHDRRKTYISISKEGRALLGEMQNRLSRTMLPFLMSLSTERQSEFLELSEALIEKFEAQGKL